MLTCGKHCSRFQLMQVLATLMLNWGRHWFEHFPSPPMHVLGKLEELLSHHDPNLHQLLAPGAHARLGP